MTARDWLTLQRWRWMLWWRHGVVWSTARTEAFVRRWWAMEQRINANSREARMAWWEQETERQRRGEEP